MQLSDALRYNKTLVKLDLSNNALKGCMTKYIFESIMTNTYLAELNFAGNLLDDVFALQLANTLTQNQVLYKVDISNNPIGPAGAQLILDALYEHNDTLGDIGDLSESYYMGVRIREDLIQAIKMNNSSHARKRAFIEEILANTRNKNRDDKANRRNPLKEAEDKHVALEVQQEYPLLKPITFTNTFADDYLDSGVWANI